MALNPFKFITDIAGKVLNKVVGDKASEEQKLKFELDLLSALNDQEDEFLAFVVEHSGAAKDMPKSIQILRGCVRPLITIWAFGLFNWSMWFIFNTVELDHVDRAIFVIKLVFGLNLVTLGFWFGTKALERSGIAQILMGWGKKNGE